VHPVAMAGRRGRVGQSTIKFLLDFDVSKGPQFSRTLLQRMDQSEGRHRQCFGSLGVIHPGKYGPGCGRIGQRKEKDRRRSCHSFGVTLSQVTLSRATSCVDFWVLAGLGGSGVLAFWRDRGSGGSQGRASVRAGELRGTKIGWAFGHRRHK
jgi:hypothetical protein